MISNAYERAFEEITHGHDGPVDTFTAISRALQYGNGHSNHDAVAAALEDALKIIAQMGPFPSTEF